MKSMSLISTGLPVAFVLILALCLPVQALAVSTITMMADGEGVFLVQGVGIEDAAALEINVAYDIATLANPRITAGPLIAGAMTAINPNIPGTVRMVMIRITPVKGSGVIATLVFDLKGSSPGKITSLTARLANIQGANLPVLVQINSAPDVPKTEVAKTEPDPAQSQESTATAAPRSQTAAPLIIIAGSPAAPGEARSAPDTEGAKGPDDRPVRSEVMHEQQEEPMIMARGTDRPAAAGTSTGGLTREIHAYKSILDRFREYKGARTAGAFVSLFDQEGMFWFRQDPPVALSDGKTVVRVTFISAPGNKTASDMAVMGARLISLKRDPENTNTWIAELKPEQGEYRASIAVFQGEAKMVFPLTIAPKVAMGTSQHGEITRADFDRYVAGHGPGSSSGFDANRDGKRDYLDDYIMTANYLAAAGMAHGRK